MRSIITFSSNLVTTWNSNYGKWKKIQKYGCAHTKGVCVCVCVFTNINQNRSFRALKTEIILQAQDLSINIRKVPHVGCIQCFCCIFLRVKLDESKVSSNPDIQNFAIWFKMPLQIPCPGSDMVKVNHKQSLCGPHISGRSSRIATTRSSPITFLLRNVFIETNA